MSKSAEKDYIVTMKNAEASVRMEDCEVASWMREHCQKVLDDTVTAIEVFKQFAAAKAARVMK